MPKLVRADKQSDVSANEARSSRLNFNSLHQFVEIYANPLRAPAQSNPITVTVEEADSLALVKDRAGGRRADLFNERVRGTRCFRYFRDRLPREISIGQVIKLPR